MPADDLDGPRGWVVVAGGFVIFFSVFGLANLYALFQPSMMADRAVHYPSQATLSLGNSITAGLTPVFGAAAGILADHLPVSLLCLASIACCLLSLWLPVLLAGTPLALVLLFALPSALASGLLATPVAAAVSTWFVRDRMAALGILFAGGGIGGSMTAAVASALQAHAAGWRASFSWFSLLTILAVVATPAVFKRDHAAPATSTDAQDPAGDGAIVEPRDEQPTFGNTRISSVGGYIYLLRHPRFGVFCLLSVSLSYAFCAFLYLPVQLALVIASKTDLSHAVLQGGGETAQARLGRRGSAATMIAGTLLMYSGIGQVLGSLTCGLIVSAVLRSDEAMCILSCIVASLDCCLISFTTNTAVVVTELTILGYCAAAAMAALAAMLAKVFHGPNLTTAMAFVYCAGGITALVAAPSQAALQKQSGGACVWGLLLTASAFMSAACVGYLCAQQDASADLPLRPPSSSPASAAAGERSTDDERAALLPSSN